jgi:DNA end-binding protein Ku
MARAVWSGAISFGLVNVPVKAYTAVRDHEVHFHQLERGTGARVRHRKVSERSGEEVDADDIELGYELAKGRYVAVEPGEIDALRPRTTRAIEVRDFVALADIDPVYYDHTYWLAPADEPARHAYGLLLAAMEDRGRVGIGTVVMRRKQYLAAIRPLDGAVALSTMRFADEIVDRRQIDAVPDRRAKPDARELKLATGIVDGLASDWEPGRYHDTYTDELRDLIERRAKGETITVEEPAAPEGEVLDLMAALEASVKAAKGSRKGRAATGTRTRKAAGRKAPAGKTTARKPAARKAPARKAAARKSASRRRSA